MSLKDDLSKIQHALQVSCDVADELLRSPIRTRTKQSGDPVTEMDTKLDAVLKDILPEKGDGWLSEESVDDLSRLNKSRVWIVDPLDGTREFVAGMDEWCVSIALAQDGKVIAAGICNPLRKEHFVGSLETGITLNGAHAETTTPAGIEGISILASRSEVKRRQWDCFGNTPVRVIPLGSVAYKLARVAAGLNDATFSLAPKSEWDIAAGVMLVQAAGGKVTDLKGNAFTFNNENILVDGEIAAPSGLFDNLYEFIQNRIKTE